MNDKQGNKHLQNLPNKILKIFVHHQAHLTAYLLAGAQWKNSAKILIFDPFEYVVQSPPHFHNLKLLSGPRGLASLLYGLVQKYKTLRCIIIRSDSR